MPATEIVRTEVTFEDIRQAAARIQPIAKRTPVMHSRGFDSEAKITAFFKCENFQTGGAFKIHIKFLLHICESRRVDLVRDAKLLHCLGLRIREKAIVQMICRGHFVEFLGQIRANRNDLISELAQLLFNCD